VQLNADADARPSRRRRFGRTNLRWPIIIVAAFIASACIGDESEKVYLHNTLNVAVTVAHHGDSGPWQLVQPGQTATNQWIVAGMRNGKRQDAGLPLRQIEAKTESGELVFCHRYSDTDLDGLKWTIEIKRIDDCK
jgi:hypothetical protein